MFYDYGDDVYIECTTLQDFQQLPSYERTWQQTQLYRSIAQLNNDHQKNLAIYELSHSADFDDDLVRIVYNDLLENSLIATQLLQKSQFSKPPDIPDEFLTELPTSVSNRSKWVCENFQYNLQKPCILVYQDLILGMQKTYAKNDLKVQVDLVYVNGQLFKNQTLYIEQQGVRVNGQQYGKLDKFYVFTSTKGNVKTKLCSKLAKKGLIHSFIKQLQFTKFENKQNVNLLIYECLLFETQEWCQKVLCQDWIENLINLCLNEVKDAQVLFHQIVLYNLQNVTITNFTEQQTDWLFLRLHQYFEASQLDLKQKKTVKETKTNEDQPKSQTTNKDKGKGKPKGVGYGDINYTQSYLQQGKKKDVSVLDTEQIYQQADDCRWEMITSIFKHLEHINLKYIQLIEDSSLIPVMKSIISSLNKSQTIKEKYQVFQSIFILMELFLEQEAMHLFTCKDYGDVSLFEILQKAHNESLFREGEGKEKEIIDVTTQLQQFYTKLIDILEQNRYLDINYEETETQTVQDPKYLYPIIMKPLVLKTSEITKQQGWRSQLNEYFNGLQSTPPNNKMNKLVKELSDIGENLPLQITNSIFLRYDKDRMDTMQALIFGSSGTPYAHGAFIYNLLFCDDYPSRPPKCLLETTGHGKVRFNPNLYNCGKVCLSLLGTWGDNWDPNQSTLLQILVSIQAMVMSEYVYYNEPGWESSMGTVEGEKNNRGYCNIVKLANIRYAMIEQLQKPPAGFEEVIQKSFYLRKDEIIKEVQQWVDEADFPVNYSCTQNNNISAPFQQNPAKFKTVLLAEFDALKKELEKLKVCITHQSDKKLITINKRIAYSKLLNEKKQIKDKKQQQLNTFLDSKLPEIDVTENSTTNRQFDIQSLEVQNLMSRYIGVMGLESVNKQSQASVIVYGLTALGIETAKNLVLSGLKRLTIIEGSKQNNQGQFFIQNKEQSRLEQSLIHLQGLNPYVQIDYSTDIFASINSNSYQVVCLTEIESIEWVNRISLQCRELKIGLIVSQLHKVYGRVFVDLGESFMVNDVDGEQITEFIVEDIDQLEGLLKIKGKHNLSVGDIIELKETVSEEGKSYNQQFQVQKVINKSTIHIGDLSAYAKYVRNGRGQTIKQKITIQNAPMSQLLQKPIYDPNFMLDQEKYDAINQQLNTNQDTQIFPPQAAYLAGVVCQEIIKAITHKYMPIRQCYFHSCEELLHDNEILGQELSNAIADCRLLLIGAGAIGCELLKNYAMISLGTKGVVIVTDPDVIEKSNLSRQFLFREKHLRQPKSYTAANACLKMNSDMKIVARLDKVSHQTEQLYGDVFQYVDVVTNALDNVQARLYVDSQCIEHMKPLLESGTLGPKGHVQVILPNLTESYGSKQDPEESNDIPYCTLKMFPEDSNHCLEWARDKFEKLFTTKLQQIHQALQFKDTSIEALEKTLKFCKNRPKSFEDCVQYALNKFYKYFVYGIWDLLKAYPLDHLVNGKLFWSSPKRPPQIFEFKGDEMQLKFIQATSLLYAQATGIPTPQQIDFEGILLSLKPKEYRENKEKLQQIQEQVQKEEKTQNEQQQSSQSELIQQIVELHSEYYEITDSVPKIIKPLDFLPNGIQFEKDEDDNYHVNFIQSALNCRAYNYGLEQIDWLTTKLKAGRIVPAMATTTACIAGLQTIELVKVIKKLKIDQNLKLEAFKNMFLNLAIPYALQSEPGECEYQEMNGQKFSFWSRWDVKLDKNNNSLEKFINLAEQKFHDKITCIQQKAKLLYSPILFSNKQEEQKLLSTPIYLLFEIQEFEEYIQLDLTFKIKIKCRFYF